MHKTWHRNETLDYVSYDKKCSFCDLWYNLVQFKLVRIDNVRYCKISNTQLDKITTRIKLLCLNNHKKSIAIVSLLIKDIALEKWCFIRVKHDDRKKEKYPLWLILSF